MSLSEEISNTYSDQSCKAIEIEYRVYLNSLDVPKKRIGNVIILSTANGEIYLRGDNLITRKQASKKLVKDGRKVGNDNTIWAFILMPHIPKKGRCQINSKRATAASYFDNPFFFLEKLRLAYINNFEIINPDIVEEWIIEDENVLFWKLWGDNEDGYNCYLKAFCMSFLPKLRERYLNFFGDNWQDGKWDEYNNLLKKFSEKRKTEVLRRINEIEGGNKAE